MTGGYLLKVSYFTSGRDFLFTGIQKETQTLRQSKGRRPEQEAPAGNKQTKIRRPF